MTELLPYHAMTDAARQALIDWPVGERPEAGGAPGEALLRSPAFAWFRALWSAGLVDSDGWLTPVGAAERAE